MSRLRKIALAGNPNVGKSTVFNALTGLKQHTGNWPGKTVASAQGRCRGPEMEFLLMDVPGAYSLWAQSAEEEVAMEAVCFGGAEAVIVVCDATCLERNLNLVFQVLELTDRAVVCVNLLDEARKKGVEVDLPALEDFLGVPVVGAAARSGEGIEKILPAVEQTLKGRPVPRRAELPPDIARAAAQLAAALAPCLAGALSPRFAALRLLEGDGRFREELARRFSLPPGLDAEIRAAQALLSPGEEPVSDRVVSALYQAAEQACRRAVRRREYDQRQLRLDRLLTGRVTGLLGMLALLALVFFLTLWGANRPSAWLSACFARMGEALNGLLRGWPPFWRGLLLDGVYRTLTQVIAVMLPPMAIFFPLFTLLEDLGYLPRVAFNLDRCFEKCHACGKQALTMCMGFGCNAVGVTGCRIIDSPRERLIAMLTNALMPCNGRFPTLLLMLTLFFAGSGPGGAALSALMLTGLALLAVGMTLLLSRLLSATALRGVPSAFTLELPPYRAPQVGRVIVRSVLDRTVFVLGRAAAVAAPAGACLYLLATVCVNGTTLLSHIARFLSPLGRLMGLDGVILAGFLLGFPANEIVLPIIFMAYTAGAALPGEMASAQLLPVLAAQGWGPLTALNLMLFSIFHFPCSTTLLTVYRETRSGKWTLLAAALPTVVGILLCILTTAASKIL